MGSDNGTGFGEAKSDIVGSPINAKRKGGRHCLRGATSYPSPTLALPLPDSIASNDFIERFSISSTYMKSRLKSE
jgi:hypothetical protein